MKRFGKQGQSITAKMLVPMIAAILLQAGFFCGTLVWGGTLRQLEQNAFDIMDEKINGRRNYLQAEMLQRWGNIGDSAEAINALVNAKLKEQNAGPLDLEVNSPLSSEVLQGISDDLITMMRKNSVTGAFIIFEGGKEAVSRPALYIRDTDPSSFSENNSDLLLERAPVAVVQGLGIPMDSLWEPSMNLENLEQAEFYEKPFHAAQLYPEAKTFDLGYWSTPFHLPNKDKEIITYSLPLRQNGTVYGVIGVEISVDYIRQLLPYDELEADGQAAYVLAVSHGGELRPVVTAGTAYKVLFDEEQPPELGKQEKVNQHFYRMDARTKEPVYGCVRYMQLYNTNTPFENDRWMLMGIIRRSDLMSFSNGITQSLMVALGVSVALGVLGMLGGGYTFTRPIHVLVKKVRETRPGAEVRYGSTRIREIDELAGAIETLYANAVNTASKLSQIIHIANIPIGAFEWQKDTDSVFYTDMFFSILGGPDQKEESGYLEKQVFRKRVERMLKGAETEEQGENSWLFCFDSVPERWATLKVLDDGSREMGVLVDVTREMLDKRKIEYERDYDVLTNLKNRRAFHSNVTLLLNRPPEKRGVCAFVMMDLDNLKYINDTYGHDYGDEYIRCAASAIAKMSPYRAVVGRMSGDEFSLFFYGYPDKETLRTVLERIPEELKNTTLPTPDGKYFRIRASGGVAFCPEDADSFEELRKYADFSMYIMKNTTKGQFTEFNRAKYDKDSYLLHSREELNKIIDDQLVQYFFQPIVDLTTGEIFGYEALMRSHSRLLPSPLEILTLAKSQSKLYQIERLTWYKALEDFTNSRDFPRDCRIFINSISNQKLTETDVAFLEEHYRSCLSRIVLEATEEEQVDKSCMQFKQSCIQRWGAEVALDDFGTGYNSEATLLELMPQYVKIDMSIIRGIDRDKDRQSIFISLQNYCHDRGISVLAEGVETSEELKMVISLGADYVQGYYLGKANAVPQSIPEEIKEEILLYQAQAKENTENA